MQQKLTFYSIFFLFFLTVTTLFSQAPCGCNSCSFPIANNFNGDFVLQIDSASNNDLSSNLQGLCGVKLKFGHESVGQLKVELISPAGQVITLVSASNNTEKTYFSTWDLNFIGCNLNASPDANHVANWDENTAWGQFGGFNGTYYPATGCLENFNTGPVNGNWILRISDNGDAYPGFLFGFSLEFCNPNGIACSTEPILLSPGDNCQNATVFSSLDGISSTIFGAPAGTATNFCGTVDAPQWLGFVPSTSTVTIVTQAGNCTVGNGLQCGIYSDCSAPPIACNGGIPLGAGTPITLTATNLIPNNTYYLMVDGFAGDVCDFKLDVIPPQFSTLAKPSTPQGFASLCMGGSAAYVVPPAFGATGYIWKINGNGIFENQTQQTTTFTNTPEEVTAIWSIGGGQISVAAFNENDTTSFSFLDVTITSTTSINYPAVYLCANDLPYQLPFSHPLVSLSGTYSTTLPSANGCDTILSITVFANNAPLDVYIDPVILLNDQCFTLPSGQQLCEGGTYVFQENAGAFCTTNYHYDITKIKVAPLVFACAPVSVPFIATGSQAANLQWTFLGGMPADTVGALVEAVYTSAGSFGFTVKSGTTTLNYPDLFNIGDRPDAVFTIQQQMNTFTLFDTSTGMPSVFHWDFGDGAMSTGAFQVHDFDLPGVYDITFIATNACGSDTMVQTVSWTSGIVDAMYASKIEVTPNPTEGDFQIKMLGENCNPNEVYILNALGQKIASTNFQNHGDTWLCDFSLKNHVNGVYYAKIRTDFGEITRKIIKI
jgi:PKD domain/Secretion system C-terminal sorting domain/Proprotein convertase P-domain